MKLQVLQKEMVAAMKARDKERKETLSALVSAVKKLAIDEGKRDDVPEELVDRAILKELKTVREQLDTCPDERVELKTEYQNRYNVISEFAPKMMTEDEIKEVHTTQFAELVATKNKGQIMKEVIFELKGKADGKTISKVVAELCK